MKRNGGRVEEVKNQRFERSRCTGNVTEKKLNNNNKNIFFYVTPSGKKAKVRDKKGMAAITAFTAFANQDLAEDARVIVSLPGNIGGVIR